MTTPNLSESEIFSVDRLPTVCIVTFTRSQLRAASAEALGTALLQLLRSPTPYHYVLDFSQVRSMESGTLGALVLFLKELTRHDGTVLLCGMNEYLRYLFALTRLDQVFSIYADVPAAIATFQPTT